MGARIISVADYYDSVINPCSAQWQKSHQEALQELLSAMGTSFDPEIVKAFVEAIAPGNTFLASAATKTAETEKIAETGEAKEYA